MSSGCHHSARDCDIILQSFPRSRPSQPAGKCCCCRKTWPSKSRRRGTPRPPHSHVGLSCSACVTAALALIVRDMYRWTFSMRCVQMQQYRRGACQWLCMKSKPTPSTGLRLQRCGGVLLLEELPLEAVRAVNAVPVAARLNTVPVGRRPQVALQPAVRRHCLRHHEACTTAGAQHSDHAESGGGASNTKPSCCCAI